MKRTPINIFIDLNVILDVLLARRGYQASLEVIELPEYKPYRLYLSAHMVTTFMYLLQQAKVPRQQQVQQLDWLLGTFEVVATTAPVLQAARMSKLIDFEDAVVEEAATTCQAEAIITPNTKDFQKSRIPVFTPEDFLQRFL